ncbi:MAG TPA: GNAT family N-acetyltransferase [Rugosimonospora sp.]|jgi:hypothetical protein
MRFEIWDARDARDRARWRAAHEALPTREVYADPAYVGLFAGEGEEPLAAYAETGSGSVLYPFILRPIAAPRLDSGRCDITSAYGYAGAFCSAPPDDPDAKEFWAAFDGFCRDRRVVSEFTRLSLFDDERLAYPGRVEPRLVNVVCDLRVPEDEAWRGYEHKVRKNVNRALRGGVTIEVDETGARLDDFLRIYAGTMDRRGAAASFYFPRGFFETIIREMPGRYAFFHALHSGRVVSTELVLASADTLYSYLGGTEQDAFDLRPNDLLKVEVCRWGRGRAMKRFVLGGGHGPDDGIFRYKRAFAPDGLVPYAVGTRVLDERGYARLCEAHRAEGLRRDPGWAPDPGFFPGYRCALPDVQ